MKKFIEDKLLASNLSLVLAAYGASLLLGCLLFPDRFVFFRFSWLNYADSNLSHTGAFWVTNSLYHGGVQLWDWYDQMPMTLFPV